MNTNILLGGGPVRLAKDLQFGDRILITSSWGRKPWRVCHISTFIQIKDVEYSWSEDYKTMSFDELDELAWVHIGHDAPLWKVILTFGTYQVDKF